MLIAPSLSFSHNPLAIYRPYLICFFLFLPLLLSMVVVEVSFCTSVIFYVNLHMFFVTRFLGMCLS